MYLKCRPMSVASIELIIRPRMAVSANVDFQYRRRICEYAAQWNDSRTDLSLYNCARGAFKATRNALFTPGCPTSWPMAETRSVRASNGCNRCPIGDLGAAGIEELAVCCG